MSLLFETIKCQDRRLHHLHYHNLRVRRNLTYFFGIDTDFDLENTINIPDWVNNGLYRCRISYEKEIGEISFFPYEIKHPKIIQLIESESFEYNYKYENRIQFQKLLESYPHADDVIITKNGLLTDVTYANLAFFDGQQWFTPNTYLLPGTKRAYLIDNKQLTEVKISVKEIRNFERIAFINAMRDLHISYTFEVNKDVLLLKNNLSLVL